MAETTHETTYPQTAGVTPVSHPTPETPPTSSASEQAEGRVDQAKAKAQEMATAASEHAQAATHRAGEQLEALADRVRDTVPESGQIGQTAATVAGSLEHTGEYLQEAGFDDMVRDLTGVVRRYPLQSLLVGLGLGYLLARSTER